MTALKAVVLVRTVLVLVVSVVLVKAVLVLVGAVVLAAASDATRRAHFILMPHQSIRQNHLLCVHPLIPPSIASYLILSYQRLRCTHERLR